MNAMVNKNNFDFKEFIQNSRDVLLNPKEFYSRFELTGGIVQPLIKALIYGAVAGLFLMIWSIVHFGGVSGGILGSAVGISAFFLTIVGALIGAFIMGVVLLVLSSICGGNTDYEANFRVGVSIMVIYPISAFLGFLGGISFLLGALVGLTINLYALYILYLGLSIALKGKEQSAKVTSYVLGGLLLLFTLIGIGTRHAARTYLDFGINQIEYNLKSRESVAENTQKSASIDFLDMVE